MDSICSNHIFLICRNEAEKPDNTETVPRPLPECPEEPKEEVLICVLGLIDFIKCFYLAATFHFLC